MPRHASVLKRMAITLSTIVVGLVLLLPSTGDASSVEPGAGATYVVRPGDTLWEIAAASAPQGDHRSAVDTLMAMNGLDSSLIVPGQQLVLPSSAG